MDTLDKLFALQQSLSNEVTKAQKALNSAKSPAAKIVLKVKHKVLYELHQQVCYMVLPY